MTASTAAARLNSVPVPAKASSVALIVAALLTTGTPLTPLSAQRAPTAADSARAAADSLATRLRRAEEAIAILQQQLGEQASSGVTTKSRMQLELTGRVLVHAFHNDASVNNVDDPQFTTPAAPSGSVTGLAIRQTTLGAVFTARDVLGGRFVGDIDVDFYGGQQPSSGGRTFPLLRIRTARGAVKWSNAEVLVGQESPLIAGVNPVTPAAIGTPAFVTAGNLWLWLPQVRGTIETSGDVRLGLQAAILANTTGDAVGLFETDADAAERSGRPATEARVRLRWGEEHPSEIGCGGHVGWMKLTSGTTESTHAVSCDVRVFLDPQLELRAEAYTGRGLRGLGGGGIGQNLNRNGTPLDDRGAWGQINFEATPLVRLGVGYGMDQPSEAGVPAGGRLRNQAGAIYTIVRPSGPLFFGVELRRIDTKYATGSIANTHLNVAMGFEF